MPLTETPPKSVLDLMPVATVQLPRNGSSPKAMDNGAAGKLDAKTESAAPATARLSMAADLGADGNFGERWLIVDDTRLRVVSVAAEAHGKPRAERPSADIVLDLPLDRIASASTEMLVGSGVLLLTVKSGEVIEAVRYTSGLASKFSIAGRAIEAYLKGEEPSHDLLQGLDRKVCPKCGDLLTDDNSVCVKCIDKRAVLLRLLRYTIPYRCRALVVILLTFAGTAMQLLPPILQQRLTDDVLVPHRHKSWIGLIVLGLLGAEILSIAFGIWRGRVAAYISNHMVYELRTRAYECLQKQALSYFDKRQTGSLLTRVTQDVNELQSFMVDGIQYVFVNTLQIVGILGILIHYNWKLTFIALVPLPFVIFIVQRTFRLLWDRLHRLYFLRSSLGAIISATLSGARVVKAFAQEKRETARFRERAEFLFQAGVTVEQAWATYFPILSFLTTVGLFVIWYAGGLQVFANTTNSATGGKMTIGVLMMFISYIAMVLTPIQMMTRVADWLSRASASAERVFEVLDAVPEVTNIAEPVSMPRIEGRVELRNVRFSYDKNRDVLEDVSIIVEPGEMIGLVGHSGAGKSTLTNLLSRFYDVCEGAILIDGVDIRNIDVNDLRRQVGVVLQEPFLFPGTIAENIAYAIPDAHPEKIMRAAKAANAHDFIMRLPDGYDAVVGERGVLLSGGERQRVSIARAILHDPRILILDEATASVDTETEKQIQDAITRLVRGRTTFAIAHRLSTLRNANRLMVIEHGRLAELGTHDELLAMPEGVFRKLVDMQRAVNQMRETYDAGE